MPEHSYQTQDLRDATHTVEFDYKGIDPRTYFRRLRRHIQRVQTQDGYKYRTYESADDPLISAEPVGSLSGRVSGRLIAQTQWKRFAGYRNEEETTPIGAIFTGLLATALILVGVSLDGSDQAAAIGLGVVLLVVAAFLYFNNEPDVTQQEYYYRKRARILIAGEVTEQSQEPRARIKANDMTVLCGEELVVEYRDTTGRQQVELGQLPDDVRARIDDTFTPLSEEIPFASLMDEGEQTRIE